MQRPGFHRKCLQGILLNPPPRTAAPAILFPPWGLARELNMRLHPCGMLTDPGNKAAGAPITSQDWPSPLRITALPVIMSQEFASSCPPQPWYPPGARNLLLRSGHIAPNGKIAPFFFYIYIYINFGSFIPSFLQRTAQCCAWCHQKITQSSPPKEIKTFLYP